MTPQKLIETRGEEPAFLPGHVDEAWRQVEFGLGASSIQSSPEVQESLPLRSFPWGRALGYSLVGALLVLAIMKIVGLVWPRY
ncbi:MAG: hypothetical protein Q8O00_10440 [Holophaga sp.]|nr:hypothetical protein [Holophaga sp.]